MRSNTQYAVLAILGGMSISAAGLAPAYAQAVLQDERRIVKAASLGDGVTLESLRASTRDAGLRDFIETALAAAWLDPIAAGEAFARYLASDSLTPTGAAAGWSAMTSAAFATGDYAAAAAAAAEWRRAIALSSDRSQDVSAAQTQSIATLLSMAPRQTMEETAPRAAVTEVDAAGLIRAPVTVNGIETSAVLDTGANLSVVSATEARRLGLTLMTGDGSVGSSSREAVPVRVGIADRLEIAGAVLNHVAFLVMDDAALTFPILGGYRIDAIVGLPVFKALGRTTFDESGEFRWESEPSDSGQPNVYAQGSNLYVVVELVGEQLPLHLDTGATSTILSSAAVDRYSGPVLDNLETQRRAGAGGVTETSTRLLPPTTLRLGGADVCHYGLSLQLTSEGDADTLGVLGQDVLTAFESYTLDLESMTFRLGAPRGGSTDVKSGPCPVTSGHPDSERPSAR